MPALEGKESTVIVGERRGPSVVTTIITAGSMAVDSATIDSIDRIENQQDADADALNEAMSTFFK